MIAWGSTTLHLLSIFKRIFVFRVGMIFKNNFFFLYEKISNKKGVGTSDRTVARMMNGFWNWLNQPVESVTWQVEEEEEEEEEKEELLFGWWRLRWGSDDTFGARYETRLFALMKPLVDWHPYSISLTNQSFNITHRRHAETESSVGLFMIYFDFWFFLFIYWF